MIYIEAPVRQKAELFITDFIKSREGSVRAGHKYIRRYKHGDTWRYIYEEPGHANRQEMAPEVIEALKELAKLGNRRARLLTSTIEERELRSADPLDAPIYGAARQNVIDQMKLAIGEALRPIEGQRGSEFANRYNAAGLHYVELQQQIHGDTLRELFESLNEVLKKIDRAHKGLNPATSQRQDVRQHGGYGNAIYHRSLELLHAVQPGISGRFPHGYAGFHRRGDTLTPISAFAEKRTRLEEQRVRREAEARQAALAARADTIRQYEGKAIHAIIMHMATPPSVEEIHQIQTTLEVMFPGKELKEVDWPYQNYAGGVKVVIDSVSSHLNGLDFMLSAYNAAGQKITTSWKREWKMIDYGSRAGKGLRIYNALLFTNPAMRGSARLGELVNDAQYAFIQKYSPNNGIVEVGTAQVGNYNWTNMGFSFSESYEVNNMRNSFQEFAGRHGVRLTPADMAVFKEPCHFSAFDDGKRYEILAGEVAPLTEKQISTGSLVGETGQYPLTPEEAQTKKSRRMMVHLGKKFMLHNGWHGRTETSRMNDDNEAWRYFQNYRRLRGTPEGPISVLNPEYRAVASRVQAGQTGPRNVMRDSPSQTPVRVTPTPSNPYPNQPSTSVTRPYGRTRSGRRSPEVRRPNRFTSWTYARQLNWFNTNRASLSPAQRTSARSHMSDQQRRLISDRRELAEDGSLNPQIISQAPRGMIGTGTIPEFHTVSESDRRSLAQAANAWRTAAYEAARSIEDVGRRSSTTYKVERVVNDYIYRVMNPTYAMSMAEREAHIGRAA